MRNVICSCAVVICLVPVSVARADHGAAGSAALAPQADARTRAAAEKLLGLMNANQNVEQMIQAMTNMQQTMMASQKLSAEEQKRFLERMRVMMDVTVKPMMEKTAAMSIEAYAATFTLDELNGLIAFYESPVGRTFVEKYPAVMSSIMQQSAALLPELMRKMQEEMKQELDRVRKGQ